MRSHDLTVAATYYGFLVAGLATMLVASAGWLAFATYYLFMPLGAAAVWWISTGRLPSIVPPGLTRAFGAFAAGAGSGAAVLLGAAGVMAAAGWLTVEQAPTIRQGLGLAAQQAVVAALEEFTFRGVLQRLLTLRLGAVVGLVSAAVLFGVFHAPNLIHQGVPTALIPLALVNLTVMGLVLGRAFSATGQQLALPVGLHFGWNMVSYALQDLSGLRLSGPAWLVGSEAWFPESGVLGTVPLVALGAMTALLLAAWHRARLAASYRRDV